MRPLLQPLYGLLQAKLQLITHAYFEEKDFSQISILKVRIAEAALLVAPRSHPLLLVPSPHVLRTCTLTGAVRAHERFPGRLQSGGVAALPRWVESQNMSAEHSSSQR